MKVCGPKYALCGVIISAWGVIQLVSIKFFNGHLIYYNF